VVSFAADFDSPELPQAAASSAPDKMTTNFLFMLLKYYRFERMPVADGDAPDACPV
jgi:hypothetical protein